MCRELGNGRSGTVYLAYHVELEEYRAVKVVPKSLADYDTFRKEALFLKTLRHPGIPIVYDVEEDTGYRYLIEEYLEEQKKRPGVQKEFGGLEHCALKLMLTKENAVYSLRANHYTP